MTLHPRFLQALILGVLFTSSHLCGQESDCKDSNPSSECKEQETKNDEASKKDDDTKKDSKKQETKNDGDAKKDEEQKKVEPPKIGNFSLPTSQQPAALFGFGGNIIDKGEVQLYFFADEFIGKKKVVMDLIPSVLFGITDDWSIFFNFPFTPEMRDGDNRSSGLEDFFIQLEYAFYNKSTYCYVDQATVVTNITVPTGSTKDNPPTGFGSPSLFLGGTYYRTTVEWVLFTSQGAVLTTSENRTKFGDQFLYQFGVSRYIPSPEGWIYALMLELDGMYSKKNRIKGDIDPNSGGNVFYVTPSVWISSKDMLLQFGVSLPLNQNLFGDQRKVDYAFNLNFAWSFY